jgi:hypothetical protein
VGTDSRKDEGGCVEAGTDGHFEPGGVPGSIIFDMPNLEFVSAKTFNPIVYFLILAFYIY